MSPSTTLQTCSAWNAALKYAEQRKRGIFRMTSASRHASRDMMPEHTLNQFLRAISHSLRIHSAGFLAEEVSDDDDKDGGNIEQQQQQQQSGPAAEAKAAAADPRSARRPPRSSFSSPAISRPRNFVRSFLKMCPSFSSPSFSGRKFSASPPKRFSDAPNLIAYAVDQSLV